MELRGKRKILKISFKIYTTEKVYTKDFLKRQLKCAFPNEIYNGEVITTIKKIEIKGE